MSAPVTTAAGWQWPADVLEFAARHNAQSALDPLLEATQRVFPTASRVRVYLANDAEIADDWHINFDVQVPAQDVPDFVHAQHQWIEELYQCSPAPQSCNFALILQLVS